MKKTLLVLATVCFTAGANLTANAQRYVQEIFPSFTKTAGIIYANNFQVLTGTPVAVDLKMDIYQPAGAPDPLTQRPLVIVMHTGSFLPPCINGQPTGSRNDSTIVEACQQFARRGYVAAAMSYRLGWNPAATGAAGQDIRTGTLLQAVYRALLDAKCCVRYFKKDVATAGNTYGIDTTKIILGGFGTGGYIAMAYATVDKQVEIDLPKFLANTNNASYGFVAGQSYVNPALLGDFEGYGGIPQLNNPNNSVGYTSDIHFAFNAGGALGDSSWLEAGDVPMCAFHVVGDPFAPYGDGPVIVPTTGDFVVDVSGSQSIITRANSFGNNSCFASAGFTDAYTTRANAVNGGQEGLFPFFTNPAPQAGPWEWFDSTVTVLTAQAVGQSAAQGTAIYQNAFLTNPDMSKAKALAYIDTVMNYMNPRIAFCLNLSVGVDEIEAVKSSIKVQPNPAGEFTELVINNTKFPLQAVRVFDLLGKQVFAEEGLNDARYTLNRNGVAPGMYLVKMEFNGMSVTEKVFFN
jgi:acetyl esterase/lipase